MSGFLLGELFFDDIQRSNLHGWKKWLIQVFLLASFAFFACIGFATWKGFEFLVKTASPGEPLLLKWFTWGLFVCCVWCIIQVGGFMNALAKSFFYSRH